MIAIFTICTNNYLAQAFSLAKSVRLHNPEYRFFLCLVDRKSVAIDYHTVHGIDVLTADDLALPIVEEMSLRYNIIELCTALKAFFFEHLFIKYPDLNIIHYLDPDIMVFNDLEVLNSSFSHSAIQLTPHILSPIPLDGDFPNEALFLNHGIYNLGYLGLKRSIESTNLLRWWKTRMINDCRIDLLNGLFVDQLWFNLVPVCFPLVHILRTPGANAAYWNLHERQIAENSNILFEGKLHPLYFFHFSGFSPESADLVTKSKIRLGEFLSEVLKSFLRQYADCLTLNGYKQFSVLECNYVMARKMHLELSDRKRAMSSPIRTFVLFLKGLVPEYIKKWLRT